MASTEDYTLYQGYTNPIGGILSGDGKKKKSASSSPLAKQPFITSDIYYFLTREMFDLTLGETKID